jgi:hypothetical protein
VQLAAARLNLPFIDLKSVACKPRFVYRAHCLLRRFAIFPLGFAPLDRVSRVLPHIPIRSAHVAANSESRAARAMRSAQSFLPAARFQGTLGYFSDSLKVGEKVCASAQTFHQEFSNVL